MKKSIIYLLTISLSLLIFLSCKKEYLNINENPNSPVVVNISNVLPSAQLAISHVVGNHFQVYGGMWAQYWTQNPNSSQYKSIDQYSPSSSDFDTPWRICYTDALQDLNYVVQKGTEEGKMQYVACAKILQAYMFQVLTDDFGDIPFSEAVKGGGGIIYPKYDSQQDVYNGIINLITEAQGMIDPAAINGPSTNDLLMGGNMTLWRKFANTLKLKVYLRLAYVDPGKAQAGIASLGTGPFLGFGEDAKVRYTSNPGGTNPLYSVFSEINFTQNLVASSTCVDSMAARNDDRITVFYDSLSDGSYAGLYQGDFNAGIPITQLSIPSPNTGANALDARSATAPVKFISDYESFFLQAEASARGWLSGSASALYANGIKASFESYGLTSAMATTYLGQSMVAYPGGGTTDEQVEAIITQKWFSMCGNQGNEAWTEYRRTGYPSFLVESANSILGAGKMPNRFFYPSTEVTRNPNFPGQPLLFARVWWDIN